MKYGLIVHFKTLNIGDDIQCYAMEKLLPHTDYVIDREHLDSFYMPTGEKVAAFLGGWYMHKPLNWPPSPFLKLLPMAFHVTDRFKGTLVLKDYGLTWLKRFPSIGCRDESTVKLLKSHGMPAYLSGCFTLTLKPFEDVGSHGKIVIVDCEKEAVDFIKQHTEKEIVHVSHNYSKPTLPPEVVAYAAAHDTKEVIPTSHRPKRPDEPYKDVYYKGTWSYRRALIEGLLRFYQGASLVVTRRLHVMLPCLALGVPVLLVKPESNTSNYRLGTFKPFVNHTTPEDLVSGKYTFNFNDPPINPGGHKRIVRKINSVCNEFITACENSADEPKLDVQLWLDGQRRILRLKRIIKTLMPSAQLANPEPINEASYKF